MRATVESLRANHFATQDPGLVFRKDAQAVLVPDSDLDSGGLLTPNVVRLAQGGYRLYYMGRSACSPGQILSAVSDDGEIWVKEASARIDNSASVTARRALCPDVILLPDGKWRMYFEAWPQTGESVIASALSSDGLNFTLEPGARFATSGIQHGAPRCLPLPDGRWRLYFHHYPQPMQIGLSAGNHIVSAISEDGLNFILEPGVRVAQTHPVWETYAVYAPEVLRLANGTYRMYYGAWNNDKNRGRIFAAHSADGLLWHKADGVIIDCGGERDFVFSSEPCLMQLPDGRFRILYEACDAAGVCRILSATA
jgi:predicted GH43/DUF377 family glycosyl hydrolase